MKKLVWVFVALVVLNLVGTATTANAYIILGNYPVGSTEGPGPDIGFGTQQAVKFTMGNSSAPLSNVILRLHTNSNGSNIPAIDIRNDAGSDPGTTVLFTIEGTTSLAPNGMFDHPEDYTLFATSTFTLTANTS